LQLGIAEAVASTFTDSARPEAIEDPSNLWLVHPLSWRLLPYALRLDIHPNAVSFAGMGCGLLAGLCYWHWREPGFVLAGFTLMVAWHVLDGLDGKLARASGKASPLGRVIDGICDYLAFILVLVPIALSFEDWQATLALALASGAIHAMQSIWYEAERDAWKRRLNGVFQIEPRPPGPAIAAPYHWFEAKVSGTRAIDRALADTPALLPAYLKSSAPLVRQLSILSANNRTIAIALACLAGDPRLYWYWEIGVLSLIAFWMAQRLRNREATLVISGMSMLHDRQGSK
jgi:hypothetical protein